MTATLTATETLLLDTLRDRGTMTNAELGSWTGATLTTARLRKLIPAGLVTLERKGRAYHFTAAALVETTPEQQIRAAYATAPRNTAYGITFEDVRLSVLRRMTGLDRATFDQGIKALAGEPGVHVRSEADQKHLTDEDRAAAIILGASLRHNLFIAG